MLDEFGMFLVSARNSGLWELENWLNGRYPKRPTPEDQEIIRFIERLTREEQSVLRALVRHFVDASMFNFVSRLESGDGPLDFELTMRDSSSGGSIELIGRSVDRDLLHKYFEWADREPGS